MMKSAADISQDSVKKNFFRKTHQSCRKDEKDAWIVRLKISRRTGLNRMEMLNLKGVRELEENENGFFSLWSNTTHIDDTLLLYNKHFAEDPIFNHATGFKADDKDASIVARRISRCYISKGITPAIYGSPLSNPWHLEKIMTESGFQVYDRLYVMKRGADEVAEPSSITLREITEKDLDDWIKVYMAAFDIPNTWQREISRRTRRTLKSECFLLLLAYVTRKPAATLAAYLSNGLAGFYCIGTDPKFRDRGVASGMINASINLVLDRGCKALCLQTLKRDRLLDFYRRFGFKLQYAKTIYVMPPAKL